MPFLGLISPPMAQAFCCDVDFSGTVAPGDRVVTTGRKLFFRRKKLRADAEMRLSDGTLVCSGVLSGMGIPR